MKFVVSVEFVNRNHSQEKNIYLMSSERQDHAAIFMQSEVRESLV